MSVDLKEFLGAYLAEADEQLSLANGMLLEIETSLRKQQMNPRALRDLFRALHTLKGLSAMVGVEPVVAIAHRMESSLRVADREGAGALTATAVDTLLKGVRAIELRVRSLSEKKDVPPAPRALLDELDALDTGGARLRPPPARPIDLDPALASKLAPFQIDALSSPVDGKRSIRVDFIPSPERADKGFSINSVRERLASLAEIVKVVPLSVPRSPEAPGGLSFAILMLTSESNAAIGEATGTDPGAVIALASAAPLLAAGSLPLDLPFDPAVDDESSAIQRRNIVRVDVQRLDDAMEQLSSLIVTRSRLTRVVASMTDAGANTRELSQIIRENARQLRDLRNAILRVRMVPVAEVLDRVPLIVRGLRRESGKQVRLTVDAGNAELDKAVAERIFPAIVHLVRNAVDHGIETPDERSAVGKAREATLSISCTAQSNTRLELSVTDDGRGVDRAAVSRRAGRDIANGDSALLDALCEAGLSTRAEASTTSGRGMGMDIVKRIVVGQLGGELVMTTHPGGTTFTLRVPLTIAIVDAFTLDCADQRFVVPVSMVEEIIEIDPDRVIQGPDGAKRGDARHSGLIERRGEVIPLIDLAQALRLSGATRRVRQALLVRRNGEPMAFGLERVRGQQEAVVRPLIDPLVQVIGISGATDLGDGRPTLVLDLVSLGSTLLAGHGERAA